MYLVLVVNLILLAFGCIYAGLAPVEVINIPSALIVLIPAFIAPIAAYGKLIYKEAFSAVFTSKEINPENKEAMVNVFKLIGDVAVGFGWLGTLIGAVAMLLNLGSGNPSAVGEGIAADLITILYGYTVKYGFCVLAEHKIGKIKQ
ncbi:MAG: MotA/TolQ/ExbB proton channel family protein [Leptospiraceae bacterium]|nr:MotA/TolQ/ExbB proton channel family protein [Leptospiraceae bacterium]